MMKAYIYDSQNTKIFVASSSASMLRDKKASLTGRAVSLEISCVSGSYSRNNSIKEKSRALPRSWHYG
ncbi:MAG: hypothetical protein B6I31_04040 [Desulfobacteraceae bacterium 4572_19]|nr:MAG: hypothetical protein B6I31_04040 [Desulfobacteraceae bacterium 4572_19]